MPAADVFVVGVGTNTERTSKMICRMTDSWCSHAWIEYSSLSFGGMWAIHAQSDGVVKERMGKVWAKYPTFRRFELVGVSQDTVRQAIASAIDKIGTPYDWGIIMNGIKLWWYLKTGHISRPRYNPRELHCSEFVSVVLRDVGVESWEQLDAEVIHPGKLFNFMYPYHPNFRPI